MNFEWADYHTLARTLGGEVGLPAVNEARYRTAVSRAYYACHRKAYKFLEVRYAPPQRGQSVHEWVIDTLRQGNPSRRAVSVKLQRLRRLREYADYDDASAADPPGNADMAIKEATSILNDLRFLV